jgi:hypothetical protein
LEFFIVREDSLLLFIWDSKSSINVLPFSE